MGWGEDGDGRDVDGHDDRVGPDTRLDQIPEIPLKLSCRKGIANIRQRNTPIQILTETIAADSADPANSITISDAEGKPDPPTYGITVIGKVLGQGLRDGDDEWIVGIIFCSCIYIPEKMASSNAGPDHYSDH